MQQDLKNLELKYEYCINEGQNEREFDEFVSKVSDEESEQAEFIADDYNIKQSYRSRSPAVNKRSNTQIDISNFTINLSPATHRKGSHTKTSSLLRNINRNYSPNQSKKSIKSSRNSSI